MFEVVMFTLAFVCFLLLVAKWPTRRIDLLAFGLACAVAVPMVRAWSAAGALAAPPPPTLLLVLVVLVVAVMFAVLYRPPPQ